MTTISLTSDDLRIIGHSINWELNVPYERTIRPDLSPEERQILRIISNELCCQQRACHFGRQTALIEVGESYFCEDGRMRLPLLYFRLMTEAVVSFLGELSQSPTEVEIVTGSPMASTVELLERMRSMRITA
ncbi:MAG: hypothetical protein WCL32_07120 [Planctomycetota bacterium]